MTLHTEDRLKQLEDMAIAYPGVQPSDFEKSYLLGIDRAAKQKTQIAVEQKTASIVQDGEVLLEGAAKPVPTFTVEILRGDGELVRLTNRVAIAAIGSNSSPDVLFDKFTEQAKGNFNTAAHNNPLGGKLDICVLSARLPNHAVVAGAFLGVRGSNPATVHAAPGTDTLISVGFYDVAAAQHMTKTEPNYDQMALAQSAYLSNGMEIKNPLIYVAPWGALRDPAASGPQPIAIKAIPSTPDNLRKMNSTESLSLVHELTQGRAPSGETELRTFIRHCIDQGDKVNEAWRMDQIEKLQQNHRLAPNVKGEVVFPCSIRRDNARAAAILENASRAAARAVPAAQPKI